MTSLAVAHMTMRDGVEISYSRHSAPLTPPVASCIYCHGGAFGVGDHTSDTGICEALADMGLIVYTSHFRQGAEHPHPAAIHDLEDVTRIVRENHLPVGIAGWSSGGFLALYIAQHPPDDKPFAFCFATNPVAHPGLRANYIRSCLAGTAAEEGYAVSLEEGRANWMLKTQLGYWETQEAMDRAGDQLGPAPEACPTIVVLGSADANVPQQVTSGLSKWEPKPDVIVVQGGDHGCGVSPVDSPYNYFAAVSQFVAASAAHVSAHVP